MVFSIMPITTYQSTYTVYLKKYNPFTSICMLRVQGLRTYGVALTAFSQTRTPRG